MTYRKVIINDSPEDVFICYLNTQNMSISEFSKLIEEKGIEGITSLPVFTLVLYTLKAREKILHNNPKGEQWATLTVNLTTRRIEKATIYKYDSRRNRILSKL